MSSSARTPKAARRFALETDLAPHVAPTWAEDFVVELRLLGVAGEAIGAALSEVESHCVESAESAELAFGDACAYARSLDLPTSDDASGRALLRSLAPTCTQLAGLFAVNWSFGPWLAGERLEVTWGHLVICVVALLAIGAALPVMDVFLRGAVHHPVRTGVALWAIGSVIVGVFVAAQLLLPTTIASVAAAAGLGVGALLLLGGVSWSTLRFRAGARLADPIVSPFGPAAEKSAPTSRLARLLESPRFELFMAAGMIPAAAVVLSAVTLILRSATPSA